MQGGAEKGRTLLSSWSCFVVLLFVHLQNYEKVKGNPLCGLWRRSDNPVSPDAWQPSINCHPSSYSSPYTAGRIHDIYHSQSTMDQLMFHCLLQNKIFNYCVLSPSEIYLFIVISLAKSIYFREKNSPSAFLFVIILPAPCKERRLLLIWISLGPSLYYHHICLQNLSPQLSSTFPETNRNSKPYFSSPFCATLSPTLSKC